MPFVGNAAIAAAVPSAPALNAIIASPTDCDASISPFAEFVTTSNAPAKPLAAAWLI